MLGATSESPIPLIVVVIAFFILFAVLEVISRFADYKIKKGNVDLDSWYYCVVDPKLREIHMNLRKKA